MHNDPHLPQSARHYDLSAEQYIAALEATLPVIARVGSNLTDSHLKSIASQSRLPRENSLLQDNEALYEEALRYAHSSIWPLPVSQEEDQGARQTPVEALRELVRATFVRFQTHPNAVRAIVSENMFGTADLTRRIGFLEESPVVLHLDRVLMRGHDIGAFRYGVSAEDVFILITSLCAFATTQGPLFHALYGMDATDEPNSRGLSEMTCDAVVAFLTTTMPTSQGTSYTHSSPSGSHGTSVAASLYNENCEVPSELAGGSAFIPDADEPASLYED